MTMRISIIVCTYNRSNTLVKCLDSIHESLSYAAPEIGEIVVVDNNSGDNTSSVVSSWAKKSNFPVHLVVEKKQGLAAARNLGIRTAQSDLFFFTDDDCIVHKETIAKAIQHAAQDKELVLRGGRVELGDPGDLSLTIKTSLERVQWRRRDKSAARENLGNCFHGCNMMVRRAIVEKIGYFDEDFGAGTDIPAGEDTDYIFRAYAAGITIEYEPEIAVSHYHARKSSTEGYELFCNYMIGSGALYAKHFFQDPNLCRQFYWDIKNAIQEIITKKNMWMPNIGFSHKSRTIYSLLGALKYFGKIAKRALGISDCQKTKPRILFITAHPYLPQMYGGLQNSTHQLCHNLKNNGYDVSVLAALLPNQWFGFKARIKMKTHLLLKGKKITKDRHLGYTVWRTWFPWEAVEFVAGKEKPDLIVVLAMQPVRMALAAKPTHIPLLIQLQDVDFSQHGGPFESLGILPCVANSSFTANRYRDVYGVNPTVIHPFISLDDYKTHTTRENVTFVNPVKKKGLDIALGIAELCPEIPFVFVKGWPLTSEQQNELDAKLSKLTNVTLMESQSDMRSIYSKSKILIAPSVVEEAYGRIVTEAQVSGIPVIASTRGGLPEAVGNGGILLDINSPIEEWAQAVKKLWNDQQYYRELSEASVLYANRKEMTAEHRMTQWLSVIQSCIKN